MTAAALDAGPFTGPEAARLAGISYRNLTYWVGRGLIGPTNASGSGVPLRLTAAHVRGLRFLAIATVTVRNLDEAADGVALAMSSAPGDLILWWPDENLVTLHRAPAAEDEHYAAEVLEHLRDDAGRLVWWWSA